jgi:bifunctional ADP-heptose synthase (sugar kinase/adenylyltransferase)
MSACATVTLDTRSKIISLERARKIEPAHWISGSFDPLLAEHVRRLAQHVSAGRALVVEVTDPASPLLPQRARAELVAALAMVDYVVLGAGEASSSIEDGDVTEHFSTHVLERHREENGG